jgi:mono/diheme cytochrome c family protein
MNRGGVNLGGVAVAASAALTFLFFAFIVGPGLKREWDEPLSSPGAPEVTKGMTGWLDPAEAPARKGRDLPPVDPDTVMVPRPELLSRGAGLYRQNCASCHGDHGLADGPAGATLTPRPRNFSQKDGWKNGYRITDLYKTITSGLTGTGMAAFDYILPADRMALVHHVRSLGAFDHGPEDQGAIANLAAQFKSAGGRLPNRIPVSMAIAKLEKEAPAVRPLDVSTAPILSRVIADPDRAARTLAAFAGLERLDQRAPAIAAGAPGNGFRVEIATLGPDEWQILNQALLRATEGR